MMKFRPQKISYCHKQAGFSLMEVLVSVFLVGFALLALVAMQVKTHKGVREAENLTIVAMAVDSLAEGMRANPDLTAATTLINGEDVLVTTKSWASYTTTTAGTTCTDPNGLVLTKEALRARQVCEFNVALANLPESANAVSTITNNGVITVTWNTGQRSETRSYQVSVNSI